MTYPKTRFATLVLQNVSTSYKEKKIQKGMPCLTELKYAGASAPHSRTPGNVCAIHMQNTSIQQRCETTLGVPTAQGEQNLLDS